MMTRVTRSHKSLRYWLLPLAASLLFASADSHAQESTGIDCQMDNPALRAMGESSVRLKPAGGEAHKVLARLADNARTRAAGFQHVCASVISDRPILFVFERAVVPSFHMRNVKAPIDIAFIRADGSIDSIHAMQPYSMLMKKRPQYRSNGPIVAALEVRPGYFSELSIDLNASISWQAVTD